MNGQKSVLITGASSGFGKLAVVSLLTRGHFVMAALRGGKARGEAVFKDILKLYSDRLHFLDIHMEKPETFSLAQGFVQTHLNGRLDVLINNAGYGLFGAVEDQTPEQLRYQFDVNVFGPVLFSRELLPPIRKSRGKIINISSIAGLVTFPFYTSYCASKFALEAFTEGLHYELKPFGVQVCLVEPGGFRTEFGRSKLMGEGSKSAASPYYERSQAFVRGLDGFDRRLGDPMVVVNKIIGLCEKSKIPLRVPAGIDSWLMIFLKRLVPDRVRVSLIDFGFRKALFHE